MNRDDLLNSIHNPAQLERLYRENPNDFSDIFLKVHQENQDSIILGVWKERLFYGKAENRKEKSSKKQIFTTVLIALLTGFIVKIPQHVSLIDGEWFYPRYPVLLTLSAISVYFILNYSISKRIIRFVLFSIAILFFTAGALAFPLKSDTFILSCIHFPLVRHRNPGPLGQVRVQRLCHLYDSMLLNDRVVATTNDQGVTNESISKVITNDLALPVPYNLGA